MQNDCGAGVKFPAPWQKIAQRSAKIETQTALLFLGFCAQENREGFKWGLHFYGVVTVPKTDATR